MFSKQLYKKAGIHALVWMCYFSAILLLDYTLYSKGFHIIKEFVVFTIQVWIFYSFYYSLQSTRYGKNPYYIKTIAYFLLSISITVFLNLVRGEIGKQFGRTYFPTVKSFIWDTTYFYIQFSFYALGYFFGRRAAEKNSQLLVSEKRKLQQENENLELANNNAMLHKENLQLEKSLLESENNFLRAQINPHFLYNCLNFFFSETFEKQPEVAEGILTLSQIMRYSLSDYRSSDGLALLTEETEHIQNVIKIYQMRFADNLQIKLKLEGNHERVQVAPMVLITLVENVFKHGNLHDAAMPATITCTVDKKENSISIVTFNKKKKGAKELSTSIGMANTMMRLKGLYGDKYAIKVSDEEDTYRVALTMPVIVKGVTNNQN